MFAGRFSQLYAAWFDPADGELLQLRRDQLRLVVAVARGGPLQQAATISLIAAVAAQWHGLLLVGAWLAGAAALVCLSRAITARVKAGLETDTPYRRLNAAYVVSCICAVTSVASAGLLFWVPGDASNHLFVLLVQLIAASLAVAQQASHPPAAMTALIYIAVAFSLCLSEGKAGYLLLAVLGVAVVPMLAGVAIRTSRIAVDMLRSRYSELDLLAQQQGLMIKQVELVRQLREANQSKADFLARMSHELRTPLNAVIGFSDVMRQEALGPIGTPAYLDYLTHIHSSGSHLLGLINDILDLSKMEAGRFELREGLVDLWEVVHDATSMMSLRAAEGGVVLINELQPGIELQADETAIRQIAINVVTNAIKFTPAGGQVRWSVGYDLDGAVLLKLADTGVGIAPGDFAHVFEAFGQAKSGYSAKERGTGLGLPIVQTLMRLHGGEALLESTLGEGTTVTLRFPAARVVRNGRKAAA